MADNGLVKHIRIGDTTRQEGTQVTLEGQGYYDSKSNN